MILFFEARQEMKKDFQFSFLFFHLFMSKMFGMRRNGFVFKSLKKILISPIVFNSHNKVGIFREIVEKYIMQIYA